MITLYITGTGYYTIEFGLVFNFSLFLDKRADFTMIFLSTEINLQYEFTQITRKSPFNLFLLIYYPLLLKSLNIT